MGSVRSSLTVSSGDVLATAVNITSSKSITADSGIVLRAKVRGVAAGDALTVYKADDKTVSAYLYVKNMHSELENYLYLINTTDSNGAVAKIGGGEFCFIPVYVDKTYKVYGTLVDQMVEYMVFGQDNPANTLG
jgi:hypothetical protein